MPIPVYNVLFLCTGNSARSIMAEAILGRQGDGRFLAHSGGSQPKGEVHPHALAQLERLGYPLEGLRSKGWDEFDRPGAPEMDFIFTVCDDAANEICPVWPGHPMTAHWGIPDPARVSGREIEIADAFRDAYSLLERRIALFTALRLESLDRLSLHKHLVDIGQSGHHTFR